MFRRSSRKLINPLEHALLQNVGSISPRRELFDLYRTASSRPYAELSNQAVPQNKDGDTTSTNPIEANSNFIKPSGLTSEMTQGIFNFLTELYKRYPQLGNALDHLKDDGPVRQRIRFKSVKSKWDLQFQDEKKLYYAHFADARNMSLKEYIDALDQHSKDLVKDTEVCMRIKPEILKIVLANNDRFKSLFEANTSNGPLTEERRIAEREERRLVEKVCLGNYNPGLANELRMIYGYIAKGNQLFGPISQRSYLDKYGNIAIIFKDYVKQRTSFTIGDSLSHSNSSNVRAVPLENPNGDCFPLKDARRVKDEINRLGLSLIIDTLDPLNKHFNDFTPYIEAQIHYGAHPKEIKKVLLTDSASKDEELIQLLEKRKIPFEILAAPSKSSHSTSN
jgi:hypothetical protein